MTTMNVPLAFGLVLLTSIVCGIALWPTPAAVAAVQAPVATPPVHDAVLPAGSEADVARAALAMMRDAERSRAIVAAAVDASVLMRRRVPCTAVASGGGVMLADLDELTRQLLVRLLRHAAATLTAEQAAMELTRLEAKVGAGVTFAWAGERRFGQPYYMRLHGCDFVVEWVGQADGSVHAAWRDFARDAAKPWLVDVVFGKTPR